MEGEAPRSSWLGTMIRGLPVPVKAGLVVAAVAVAVGAGRMAYTTYDFVQHDNDFCMSCHLMGDAFERFARSEHRGMGCKACHQPTLMGRSQMAVSNFVSPPDSSEIHAEVPNERCASCHIEGDPERWRVVAATAGHRVHFESTAPELEGLKCVECHSTSLHEFAPVDRSCGASECHSDVQVRLGRMGDFTIHCIACHSFTEPVPAGTPLSAAVTTLAPGGGECLSCHAMRERVSMPEDDPHEGKCASCHNPHTQETPAQAVESCATAGCHTDPGNLTPMHRGLEAGQLEECMTCHIAHDFHANGGDCRLCHSDIHERDSLRGGRTALGPMRQAPGNPGGERPSGPVADAGPRKAGVIAPGSLPGAGVAASLGLIHPVPGEGAPGREYAVAVARPAGAGAIVSPPTAAAQESPARASSSARVWHDQHRDLDCLECHSNEGSHGRITVTTAADCRACHHAPPVWKPCTDCHAELEYAGLVYSASRTLTMTVGTPVTRRLPLDHRAHESVECTDCHTAPSSLDAAAVDCSSCHEEHHRPETRCVDCHAQPEEDAHDVQAHLGCGGSGCHTDVPVAGVSRTRTFCLTCHQDLLDHRPEGACEDCHVLPEPSTRGARPGDPQAAAVKESTPAVIHGPGSAGAVP